MPFLEKETVHHSQLKGLFKLKTAPCEKQERSIERKQQSEISLHIPVNKPRKKPLKIHHELTNPKQPSSSTHRRRSNTPPRDTNHPRLANRRMTDTTSLSIDQYLKGKSRQVSKPIYPPASQVSPDEESYLKTIQHKLRDRRCSTPTLGFETRPVLRHCPTLSESLERLTIGKDH